MVVASDKVSLREDDVDWTGGCVGYCNVGESVFQQSRTIEGPSSGVKSASGRSYRKSDKISGRVGVAYDNRGLA